MTVHTLDTYLGAATEARFAEAFANCVIISAARAAKLLDLDEKTLRAMSVQGTVRAVRKGKLRGYTERDLRAYLLEGTYVECRDKKTKTEPAHRGGKVVLFSEIVAKGA